MADRTASQQTFVVRILDQRNVTWQGTVAWVEGSQQQPFRSALELLRLMDSTLKESSQEQ